MPAGKTYIKIASNTLGSAASSVTFSNLPQNYTDLILVINYGVTLDSYAPRIRFNSDTGTNYSDTLVAGNGSSAASERSTNVSSIKGSYTGVTINNFNATWTMSVQNYANTTTYKTVIGRNSAPSNEASAFVGLWRNTNAITSMTIFVGAGNFMSGSTFTLYGIAASKAPQAIGGTVTTDGSYWIHTFTSSGLFIPQQSINNVDYLVVAGGGGGGGNYGGGGGAGGLRSTVTATGGGGSLESALSLSANTSYTVTVGAGGSVGPTNNTGTGTNGSNSVFGSITSTGGGRGGQNDFVGASPGATGGSGGGGTYGTGGTGGSGTTGQGYAGGSGVAGGNKYPTAGGGGAGSIGGSPATNSSNAGNGGNGVAVAISGTSVTYAGGGGGGASEDGGGNSPGTGGTGGGGNGSNTAGDNATNGTANTGGGGGGAYGQRTTNATKGNGGSGIVIVRYPV